MAVWPSSLKCLSLRNTTVWARCKSGAVGSTPSLMRSGLPEARERSSLARSSSSRMISAAPLRSAASCSSTERNLCGAVMDDGVAFDSASLGAPGEALFRMFFGGGQHAAAFDAELAGEHQANGFGINAVLLAKYARGESFLRVAGLCRDNGLRDDGARVKSFVHEMHGAAAEFHAVVERLALRFESGKRRQQRGMDIENSAAKRRDEVRREQAHESGQAHQIHARLVQRGDHQAIVGFPLHPF